MCYILMCTAEHDAKYSEMYLQYFSKAAFHRIQKLKLYLWAYFDEPTTCEATGKLHQVVFFAGTNVCG